MDGKNLVIVIDDGSADNTALFAERAAARDSRIRVLRNERNLNYGVSLRRGFQAAKCEWVLHNGMDLPLAPESFREIVPHFDNADVIVMTRRDAGFPHGLATLRVVGESVGSCVLVQPERESERSALV